jgi:hypothetical protein
VGEYTAVRKLELDMFKAVNEAGGANVSYPWVEACTRLMRPAIALSVLAVWAYSHTYGTASPTIDNFASSIGFYLFGDRTLFYSQQAVAK